MGALVSQRSWVQVLYRPGFLLGLISAIAQIVFITAKIAFVLNSLSAVHIFRFSYIHSRLDQSM